MRIAEALDVCCEQFKASNGWLDRFKKRTGIKAKFISGESADVSEETRDFLKFCKDGSLAIFGTLMKQASFSECSQTDQ